MATNYPNALDTTGSQLRTDITSSTDMNASGQEHHLMHVNVNGAVVKLETKLGTGDSNAVEGAVLMGTGSGSSAWDTSPTILGALTVGADGSGHDVTFYSSTLGDSFVWDSSEEKLTITGTNGQTALDVADGNVTVADTVTAGAFSGPLTGNASTATEATNVTAVANDSTDETVYLTFVDGATGTQGIETDTGLTYNPSSGVLTTTSVTGNLTGNVTGNVTGDVTGDVTGNLTGNWMSITAIQESSDSFADNNTSVMTSAAIQDKIAADIATYGYAKITISTSSASGGSDGDVWFKY